MAEGEQGELEGVFSWPKDIENGSCTLPTRICENTVPH